MNIEHSRSWRITLSAADIVRILQRLEPAELAIQAMPKDGEGVTMTQTSSGSSVVIVNYTKKG